MHITAQGRAKTKFSLNFPKIKFKYIFLVVLYLITMMAALLVIAHQHEQRKLFSNTRKLANKIEELKIEHGQLLLEKATLTSSARIEDIASKKLELKLPQAKDIKVYEINNEEN